MENPNPMSRPESKKPGILHSFIRDPRKRGIFIASLVVILLISGILIWKAIQIDQLKQSAKRDQDRLRQDAQNAVVNVHRQHLRLLAKPYAWAVRAEMIRGNTAGVNDYANEMIKEKNFQSIIVADAGGKIISSTNKKFEGRPFTTVGKESYLTTDTTIVEQADSNVLVVASPVMGFNNRLGTLVINYSVQAVFTRDSSSTR